MTPLTDAGRALVSEIAARHGLADDTVAGMLAAVVAGGGTQAQFNLPELGGMGQWSAGGMTMVGDMFNTGLQARVASLCAELADTVRGDPGGQAPVFQSQSQSHGSGGSAHPMGQSSYFQGAAPQWPAHLGAPSTQGSQNNQRYAVFPATHRLAIAQGGRITVYDTGAHQIGGVSQAQGGGQALSFSSQLGTVRPEDLPIVPADAPAKAPPPAASPEPQELYAPAQPVAAAQTAAPEPARPEPPPARPSGDDIIGLIERIADLRDRGILDEAEFAAKKAELLARL